MANIQISIDSKVLGEVTLKDDITEIGRVEGCQICLQHSKVSSQHARIIQQKGAFWLEDLNSTNGTFVNGKQLSKSHRLHHGDQIAIGEHSLRYISVGSTEKDDAMTEGDQLQDAGTMMINPNELKDMLKSHQMREASKRGQLVGWLNMPDGSLPLSRAEVLIGKAKTFDVRVGGLFAPRVSASVVHNRDGYYLRPRKRGKVQVNGVLVSAEVKLKDGDRIRVRTLDMVFLLKQA